jgi:hypothetical protein
MKDAAPMEASSWFLSTFHKLNRVGAPVQFCAHQYSSSRLSVSDGFMSCASDR